MPARRPRCCSMGRASCNRRSPRRSGFRCRTGGAMPAAIPAVRVRAYDERQRIVYECELPLPAEGWASVALTDLPTAPGSLRIVADVPSLRDVRAAEAYLTVEAALPVA